MSDLAGVAWSARQLPVALAALARDAGLAVAGAPAADVSDEAAHDDASRKAIGAALGLELEPVAISYRELGAALPRLGPALCFLRDGAGETVVLTLSRSRGRRASILGPGGRRVRIDHAELERLLAAPLEETCEAHVERVMGALDRAGRRTGDAVRGALRTHLLAGKRVTGCFVLRARADASTAQLAREARLGSSLAKVSVLHVVRYGLAIVGWLALAKGALEGAFEPGWIGAWILISLLTLALKSAEMTGRGRFARALSRQLKRRLLVGAMRLDPLEVRRDGIGRLLSRAIECQAIEDLPEAGGFEMLAVVLDVMGLAAAAVVGGAGASIMGALLGWCVVMALVTSRFFRRRQTWTGQRLRLTHALVERMVGHRTRLAQQRPSRFHDGEDQAVADYHQASAHADRAWAALGALAGRGWLFVGTLALFLELRGLDADRVAAAAAVILLAKQALQRFTSCLPAVCDGVIGWSVVSPLHVAARPAPPPKERPAPRPAASTAAFLMARNVALQTAGTAGPQRSLLDGCTFEIRRGDRILLEGPSGSGKSTLASLLSALLRPTSGAILLRGLDERRLGGEAWRRSIAYVPQFHQNHVLSGPFAFNLLLGRRWPPSRADLALARRVCDGLGLGRLLDRMPSGLFENVGESGWQLSHGEKSRVFLARALLSDPELIIVDESLGALDPETFEASLRFVADRAAALILIAHP